MRGSNIYFFTLEEERSTQDRASTDQQWMHREGTNPTYRSSFGSWISSKMYSCGSCFLWSCFSSQILVMYFHVPKINDEKKIYVCKQKMYAAGMHPRLGARPPHPRNGPDTTPLPYPNGQNPGKTEVCLGSCIGVGLTSGTTVEETDYHKPPPCPPRDGWVRETTRLKRLM